MYREEKTFAHVTFETAESAGAVIGAAISVNGSPVVVEASRSRGASRRRTAA